MSFDKFEEDVPGVVGSHYEISGYHFNKLNKDGIWYVVHKNKIVNYGKDKRVLGEWVRDKIGEKKMKKDFKGS